MAAHTAMDTAMIRGMLATHMALPWLIAARPHFRLGMGAAHFRVLCGGVSVLCS